MMRKLLWLAAMVALLLFGACGGDDDPAVESGDDATDTTEAGDEAEIQQVAIEAKEYSFAMPREIEAGTTEFTMKNVGKELHIAALAKIADGKTFADVTKALSAPPTGAPPEDPPMIEVGGIASTNPELSSNVTIELEAGSYFFACFLPSADGAPHVAKGMVLPFEVTEGDADAAELPEVDGAVTAKDFAFETDYQVKAGAQVIELKNDGPQQHEITLVEFAAGKGPGDLAAYFAKPEGPLPATFYGGPVVQTGGTVTWETPQMKAGTSYFFMCLIPDPADNVPHSAKGMVLPVTIA